MSHRLGNMDDPNDWSRTVAVKDLAAEFRGLQKQIDLGTRRRVVIAAHTEVRDVLAQSDRLAAMGLRAQLVGSYARQVAIWPGKDVDIFGLVDEPDTDDPTELHAAFGAALEPYQAQGRLEPQPRSWLINFGEDRLPSNTAIRTAAAEQEWTDAEVGDVMAVVGSGPLLPFTVDVVPARPFRDNYEIPQIEVIRDTEYQPVYTPDGRVAKRMTGAWIETNPLALNDRTSELNGEIFVGGRSAFVPLIKHIRQIRSAHLPKVKPSGLFYEFALHPGVTSEAVAGESWADLTKSAIDYIHGRLVNLADDPVLDPILDQPYLPSPSATDLSIATDKWRDIARQANRAVLSTDRCTAALAWQQVFSVNDRSDPLPVFPTPDGCTGRGTPYGAASAGVGANAARGGDEERGFGAV